MEALSEGLVSYSVGAFQAEWPFSYVFVEGLSRKGTEVIFRPFFKQA